jgi:hypothetical protein
MFWEFIRFSSRLFFILLHFSVQHIMACVRMERKYGTYFSHIFLGKYRPSSLFFRAIRETNGINNKNDGKFVLNCSWNVRWISKHFFILLNFFFVAEFLWWWNLYLIGFLVNYLILLVKGCREIFENKFVWVQSKTIYKTIFLIHKLLPFAISRIFEKNC